MFKRVTRRVFLSGRQGDFRNNEEELLRSYPHPSSRTGIGYAAKPFSSHQPIGIGKLTRTDFI